MLVPIEISESAFRIPDDAARRGAWGSAHRLLIHLVERVGVIANRQALVDALANRNLWPVEAEGVRQAWQTAVKWLDNHEVGWRPRGGRGPVYVVDDSSLWARVPLKLLETWVSAEAPVSRKDGARVLLDRFGWFMAAGPRDVVVADRYALERGLAGLRELVRFLAGHVGDHRLSLRILCGVGGGQPAAFEAWACEQGIQCSCVEVRGMHDRYIRFGRFVCEMGLGAELLAGRWEAREGMANYAQFTMKSIRSAGHLLYCEAAAQPRRGPCRR